MSKHHSLLQSFGALLVLDADCRRIQAFSSNFAELLGVSLPEGRLPTLSSVLGKRLSQRIRYELQGQQRLPGPLTFKCPTRSNRFQLHAYRAGVHVLVEIEPLHTLGKQRLLGTVNERLMRLAEATHQEELLDYLVMSVQELTGHDRVSVCHLDSDWHGVIVAESLAKRRAQSSVEVAADHLPALLGQRFPAKDFPIALRRAYERHSVRLIQDVTAPGEHLLPASVVNVNVSDCFLRAPAPERQQYLQRLGVRGALSVAMQGDTGLWGLLFCHSAAAYPVTPPVRDAVRTLVQMATQRLLLLRARQEARYLQRVQDSLVLSSNNRLKPQGPYQLFTEHADRWKSLFRANGVALWVKGSIYQSGNTPKPEVIGQLVTRIEKSHIHSGPWCTQDAAKEPLTCSLDMLEQSGVLAVPLPTDPARRGWLIFFRPEQVETLYWAMQPSSVSLPPMAMSPSDAWCEEVTGKSEAWQRVERLAAMDLGEDLTLAISAYEISTLNMHLERERKALAEANQRLEQLAHFDPLTQVWNRYRIEQAIDAELVAAKRYGATFALLLFDVDHFKQINDTLGHSVGDDVLISLARMVESSLRGCDHLGRWGGEEFVVLATHSSMEAAEGLAERLRGLVATLQVKGLSQPITVSIGVAVWHPNDSCKTLIARADAAMYRAKHNGRNRVEIAEKSVQ
ncbi:sensor domain-containing diguanylate cyclase [Vreelandella venusta]|uniref:sensor domain-containing diguanylate cyclase n=1 Tax=Vreelandella venusta TaxID=44935 RepID=UPI002285A4A0|nr:sensor domain-containing diguanylate cyclase [Halomonas venusta]WAM48745.1 diguanylate cyclase [Halomonas venusta]